MRIGHETVPLGDVTEAQISRMTKDEHDAYLKAYHEAYEDLGY